MDERFENLQALNLIADRLDWSREMACGYAGWLSVNPILCREMDDWRKSQRKNILSWGWDPQIAVANSVPESERVVDPTLKAYLTDLEAFKRRWHLARIAGPFPVSPAQIKVGLSAASSIYAASQEQGTHIFVPQVFPIPDRDELRRLLGDAMGNAGLPSHLREWAAVIAPEAPGKKQIATFGRIFKFQHYWSVLFSRNGEALTGHIGDVQQAFAIWFDFPPIREVLQRLEQTASTDGRIMHGPRGGILKADSLRMILKRDVLEPLSKQFPAKVDAKGLIDGGLHSFRHFFCSWAAHSNVPEQTLMDWVGHGSKRMVSRYYHLDKKASIQFISAMAL